MRTLIRCLLSLILAHTYLHAHGQTRTPAATGEENRIALVIGNSSYTDAPLANPVNDANAIAKKLQSLGFKVILRTNVTQSQMRQAVRQFGDELHAGRGVGLFYFAGHGMQINSRNFLIPIGTDIRREYEVEDQSVDAGSVLSMMQSARARVNIVILDACRNNPFARSFRNSVVGLAPMQAPAGTLLAYATAPGEVASDGSGENGLYTQHLLSNMSLPGLKIEDVFKNVRASVRQESSGKQTPWENTSLEGEFYFNINITVNIQAAPTGAASPGLSSEQVERAVSAAFAKREQDDAARRQTQQLEIERAVQAALRKREAEAAAAQGAKQGQDAQAARAAIERLNQELAELRAARQAPPTQSAAPPAVAAPTTPPPQAVALAAPAARPAPAFAVGQPAERPDVVVGNQWRYQITDLYTGAKQNVAMEVQSVTENRIYTQSGPAGTASSGSGAQGSIQVWDRHWNLLRDGGADYSSPYPELQFPLTNGRKWSSEVRYPSNGGDWRQQNSAHVIGWEKLTVPAGTFDVIKIEIRGYWQLSHTNTRMSGSGPFTEVLYYAPQARQFVKREVTRISPPSQTAIGSYALRERWELTEYSK
ncbi:MAG: caspase family protein [Burkholderiales bacterium]